MWRSNLTIHGSPNGVREDKEKLQQFPVPIVEILEQAYESVVNATFLAVNRCGNYYEGFSVGVEFASKKVVEVKSASS